MFVDETQRRRETVRKLYVVVFLLIIMGLDVKCESK